MHDLVLPLVVAVSEGEHVVAQLHDGQGEVDFGQFEVQSAQFLVFALVLGARAGFCGWRLHISFN